MLTQRKRMALIAAAACALLVASGCGNSNNNNNNGGTSSPTGTATGTGVTAQSYKDDGYLGTTNSYPRIPGHHMASTYGNDSSAMSEAIRNVPGVAGSRVTFSGADAYVTIKIAEGLRPNEIPTVESQAASVLRFNFPRYTVHVSSMQR